MAKQSWISGCGSHRNVPSCCYVHHITALKVTSFEVVQIINVFFFIFKFAHFSIKQLAFVFFDFFRKQHNLTAAAKELKKNDFFFIECVFFQLIKRKKYRKLLSLQEKMFFLNYLLANLKSEQKFKGKTNKVIKQLWKRSSYFFVFKKKLLK